MVYTSNWDAVNGKLQRYQLDSNSCRWLTVGEAVPVVVGKHGMANSCQRQMKHEGDGRTPTGIFNLGPAFGFSKQPNNKLKIAYVALIDTSECVDDVKSHYYNHLLDRSKVSNIDWRSSEPMRRLPEYRIGSVIQYNTRRPVAGKGSCIFLHVWEGPNKGTAGCIAMEASQLQQVLIWLDPALKPVIAVFPAYPAARKLLTKQFPSFEAPF